MNWGELKRGDVLMDLDDTHLIQITLLVIRVRPDLLSRNQSQVRFFCLESGVMSSHTTRNDVNLTGGRMHILHGREDMS